jgi:hypothetical protein
MVTPQIYPPPSYTDLGSVVHWHHSLLLILLTPSSFMDNVVTVPTLPISHPMTLQCPCGEPRVPTCSTLVTIFTPSTSIPCLDLLRSLSSELPRMSLSHSLLYWMAPWRSTTLGTSVFFKPINLLFSGEQRHYTSSTAYTVSPGQVMQTFVPWFPLFQ